MRLLFEEYPYTTSLLQDVVGNEVSLEYQNNGTQAKLKYVGYYFNNKINDSVFILPKVFIDGNERAFGRHDPEKIIEISTINNPLKDGDNDTLVFELSAWLYQAISHYFDRKQESDIGTDVQIQNVRPRGEYGSKTFIEIILSMLEFNKKHQNLFTYISLINSSGNNKVHWAKTISKVQPLFKDKKPYYLEFKNKSKVINFDEELIALFYSALNYLSESYHFKFQKVQGYTLRRPTEIASMIESGKGTRLLKKIRRNYYTDELVELWHLLLDFFERSEMAASGKAFAERLLVSNFNRVFEDMIDQLISDNRDEVPKELREQPDGKIVDHLYKDRSLIEEDRQIYYIGDSKYYKETTALPPNSIYKQFTYAKNVIQYNINLFNKKENDSSLRYRDPLTEGYDITPNFFIRGVVDFDDPKSQEMKIEKYISKDSEGNELLNRHFYNRLFDRDTLFLQSYNINFMFVIAAYVQNSNDVDTKKKLQTMFRQNFIEFIKEKFEFYILRPIDNNLKETVYRNFKKLIGKTYRPYESDVLIMALDNDVKYQKDNIELIIDIQKDFIIDYYELGTNPNDSIPSTKFKPLSIYREVASNPHSGNKSSTPKPINLKITLKTILLGVYKDQKHKDWILKNKKYNVRLGEREGAVKRIKQVTDAAYLVLYDEKNMNNYTVYKLTSKHYEWDAKKMEKTGYIIPKGSESNKYYIYNLSGITKELGNIDVKKIITRKRAEIKKDTGQYPAKGAPIYIFRSELLNV